MAIRELLMANTAFAALVIATASAQAQTDTQVDANDGSQDIVVTAQRRSENLRDVPMAITAITAESLQKSGVTSTSDIARLAPAVSMPFYGAFLQPAIRGVSSTGAASGDNANVAMYIDGVYQPQQIATLIDLPDVRQIEVLKGPQGALYGQNATGGAILVTSAVPSFTPTGSLSTSYGNYNAINLRGFVSGPLLGDTIAASLSGGFQDRKGMRRQVITGERDQGLRSAVVRGKLLFAPSDDAKITVTGFYTDRKDSSQYASFAINGNSLGYALIPTAPKVTSPGQYATRQDVHANITSYGGSIRGEFKAGAGTVNSITSYTYNQVDYLSDVDSSPVNFAEAAAKYSVGHYFIQDLNFVSEPFGSFSFLLGGFYLNGGEYGTNSTFLLRDPSLPPAPLGAATFLQSYLQRVDKEVFAAYADVTFKATDALTLTAGGRYTHEQQRAFGNPGNDNVVVERPDGAASFAKFSPRVTARYEIGEYSNVYASLSKGFKSGILNPNTLTQEPVKPENITAYELGYKGRLNAFSLNVSAFLYDYTDLQVVSYVAPLYLQQNAASARIKGIDIDGAWNTSPNLTLSASASFLDAKYRKFPDAQIFVPNGFGNDPVTADLSGRRMLRAPKFSGNIGANYTLDTSAGKAGAYVSAYYNSGFGFEVSNRVRTGSYATVDGELSFSPNAIDGLRLALWGKNLGNKAYLAGALTSQFADGGSYAEPRTYGFRAEFAF